MFFFIVVAAEGCAKFHPWPFFLNLGAKIESYTQLRLCAGPIFL